MASMLDAATRQAFQSRIAMLTPAGRLPIRRESREVVVCFARDNPRGAVINASSAN
jgi:hypothetical protein